MNDVETIKKAIEQLEGVLSICVREIAVGGVYVRTQATLAKDIISLISYLEKRLPAKQVATKKKGSVKGS